MMYWWHVKDARGQTYAVTSGNVIGCVVRAVAEGAREIVTIQRGEIVVPELSITERAFVEEVTQ